MPDKERLTRLLSEYGVSDRYIDDLCDEIEECYVDELEKAEKWDRVKEMASVCPLSECPVYHDCNQVCLMQKVVDALSKEAT